MRLNEATEAESSAPDLETEVDEAIRICGGDVRVALRATLLAIIPGKRSGAARRSYIDRIRARTY
jgi:hypothetical protein